MNNRVNGDLGVARAFGDFQFKNNPELPTVRQKVTCVPEVIIHERHPDDQLLILACDGLWDVMSSESVTDYIRKKIKKGDNIDTLELADSLINKAFKKGNF